MSLSNMLCPLLCTGSIKDRNIVRGDVKQNLMNYSLMFLVRETNKLPKTWGRCCGGNVLSTLYDVCSVFLLSYFNRNIPYGSKYRVFSEFYGLLEFQSCGLYTAIFRVSAYLKRSYI